MTSSPLTRLSPTDLRTSRFLWVRHGVTLLRFLLLFSGLFLNIAFSQTLSGAFEGEQMSVSGITNAEIKLPNAEYVERTVDLRVKVLGGEVKLERTWANSRWYLNPSWAHLRFIADPLDKSIQTIDRAGALYKRSGSSDLYQFAQATIQKTDQGWRWSDGQGNEILYDAAGRVISYGDRKGIEVHFIRDGEGRLTGINDHHGVAVYHFKYDAHEHLIEAKDRADRVVSYQWSGDRLTKVTDLLGNDWTYDYDAKGQLIGRTEPDGGVITIDYLESQQAPSPAMVSGKSSLGLEERAVITVGASKRDSKVSRVSKLTDKTGAITIINSAYDSTKRQYTLTSEDPLGKKTVSQIDAEGRLVSKTVNGTPQERIARDGKYIIDSTDERGLTTITEINERKQPLKITHPDGSTESYAYDATFNQLTGYTNALGNRTTLDYDAKGNLIKSIEALGKPEQRMITWRYDDYGQPIAVTVGEGAPAPTMAQTFDNAGNATSITDGNGHLYHLNYNIQGQMISIKTPLNQVWQTDYNLAGHPTKTTDPLNQATKYTTDFMGRVTEAMDALGHITRNRYTFDQTGWQTEQINALNQTVTNHYDALGRLIKAVSPSGLIAAQAYNLEGRLLNQKDPAGNTITLEYGIAGSGLEGLLTKILYPTYNETYQYNTKGLRTATNQWLDDQTALTTRVSYNEAGLPVSVTTPGNASTLTEYDALGNALKLTDALGGETRQSWDALGNITKIVDAKGNQHTFEYDKNSQLIKEISPSSGTIGYVYDAANQLIEKKDAAGNTTKYSYDAAGRNSGQTVTQAGQSLPSQTITYTYNAANQLMEITQTGETNSHFVYERDPLGRTIKETINYGRVEDANRITKVLQYRYTADGTPEGITYPDNTAFAYEYDKGLLKVAQLPNNQSIVWNSYRWLSPTQIIFPGTVQNVHYDALQRPLTIAVSNQQQQSLMNRHYQYDVAGNITERKTESGDYRYQYDRLDRLTQATPLQTLQSNQLPIESYAYDAVSNRIGSSHQAGGWIYNDKDQLTQWGEGSEQTALTYTLTGHTASESKGNKLLHYRYNGADRLTSITNNETELGHYQYDPMGRRISKRVNGETTYYLYADEGLIAELDERGRVRLAYGWAPNTEWGTTPLWQANIPINGSLQNAEYHYLSFDHLGTPQLATNPAGQPTWQSVSEAFGKTTPSEGNQITMNLRFPGQYYDAETGTHYNYFRDYNPITGRYSQSDPIGLGGGINFYAYGNGNSIMMIDPWGLDVYICKRPMDISWVPKWASNSILPQHTWLKTDTIEAGMGGDCPIPGQECADIPYSTKVKVIDHRGQANEPKSNCKKLMILMNNVLMLN